MKGGKVKEREWGKSEKGRKGVGVEGWLKRMEMGEGSQRKR